MFFFRHNVLVELEKKDLIGVNWGQLGANVLVEFENVFLIGGKCVSGI